VARKLANEPEGFTFLNKILILGELREHLTSTLPKAISIVGVTDITITKEPSKV
jgi:hypothetical protein